MLLRTNVEVLEWLFNSWMAQKLAPFALMSEHVMMLAMSLHSLHPFPSAPVGRGVDGIDAIIIIIMLPINGIDAMA
jgi:hypothetical protein